MNLEKLSKDYAKILIAVVGDVMLDSYHFGIYERPNPEHPSKVFQRKRVEDRLGGSANVAANIGALSGTPLLLGVIGDDVEGIRLRGLAEKVKTPYEFLIDHHRPTTVKIRRFTEGGIFIPPREDCESTKPIDDSLVDKIFAHYQSRDVRALVLSDYAKGVMTSPLARRLIENSKERAIPVLVDPKPANISLYKGCTVATPNLHEAEALISDKSNFPTERAAYLQRLCRELLQVLESPYAVITCGAEGIVGIDQEGKYHHVQRNPVEVFDVIGAGDTVMATLALYFAAYSQNPSFDFHEALQLANLAGTLKVQKQGTAVISLEELLAEAQKL